MVYVVLYAVAGAFMALPVFGVAWLITLGLRLIRPPRISYRSARRVLGFSLAVLVALTIALPNGWHLIESAILLAGMLPAYAAVEWMAQGAGTSTTHAPIADNHPTTEPSPPP